MSKSNRKRRQRVCRQGNRGKTSTLATLRSVWTFGDYVRKQGKPVYGTGQILKLAEETGLRYQWIYICRRFRIRWPEEKDLKKLERNGVVVSDIAVLVQGGLTHKDQNELVKFIGKFAPEHIALAKEAKGRIEANRRQQNGLAASQG